MPVAPKTSAADFLPDRLNLAALRRAADVCRGCDLYKNATQTVFGEGPRRARVVLIGETPGDREDIEGHPFVGPAGRLLDECLEAAGLDRGEVYITNAVKHFRWESRGQRRLHKTPSARQIAACRPWLDAELKVIRPAAIVCLGAVAAKSIFGNNFRVSLQRGKFVKSELAEIALATRHPSAVLRAPDAEDRHRKREELTKDLAAVGRHLKKIATPKRSTNKSEPAPG
jgi:uracil-DNA glycosylase family protein